MGMNTLTVAAIISAFAILPVRAGSDMPANGTLLEGQLLSTAACSYGYAKSKKTGKCIKLKCGSYKVLDKNGHKCVAKPPVKPMGSSTRRGSY